MDERGKIELAERALAAWNRGDLETVISKASEDLEWDLTRSDIPGESHVHRGPEAYLRFARRWREALGPTQVELEEAEEPMQRSEAACMALLTSSSDLNELASQAA